MTDPRALRQSEGAFVRPLQALLQSLAARAATLPELVADSGMPRRRVEGFLRQLADDVVQADGRYRLRLDRVEDFSAAFELGTADAPATIWDTALGVEPDEIQTLNDLIARRPAPDQQLDHVGATAGTAARRARWLARAYDLSHTRLLCVGDHDLTSMATAAVCPSVEVVVVDVDDRLLAFIDQVARERGWNVRTVWGDFRLGLPPSARAWADLVFTDPPYTPEGVETFLAAGLQGLREPDRGRLLVAYGYGEHQPALGLKVQQAVQGLHLAAEAILPVFNVYEGAQAIGSTSDLYVLQPTARTWRALPTVADRQRMQIYTHGGQSVEGRSRTSADALVEATAALDRQAGAPLLLAVTPSPVPDVLGPSQHVQPGTVLSQGVPQQFSGRALHALVDLSSAPEAWALRMLLALNAVQAAVVLPAAHAEAVPAWQRLVERKYRLSVRSTQDPSVVVVLAEAQADAGLPARVLGKAHGKLGNVWREALISEASRHGRTLTKNEARGVIAELADDDVLTSTLVELPQHQLVQVVAGLERSAALVQEQSARGGAVQ